MKATALICLVLFIAVSAPAQKIDSICFHLYTDSLKKGQHNYINVDGKLSNGHWLPMTAKEIEFSASAGEFEGNDLVLPGGIKDEKVQVKAVLRSDPSMRIQVSIWIKKQPDPEHLPTVQDVLGQGSSGRKRH